MKPGQGTTGKNELSVWEEMAGLPKPSWCADLGHTAVLLSPRHGAGGPGGAALSPVISPTLQGRGRPWRIGRPACQACCHKKCVLASGAGRTKLRQMRPREKAAASEPRRPLHSQEHASSLVPGPGYATHSFLLRHFDQTKVVTHTRLPTSSFSHEPLVFL